MDNLKSPNKTFFLPDHLRLLTIPILSAIVFGMYPAAIRGVYANGGNAILVMVTVIWVRALALTFFCLATRKPLFADRTETKSSIYGGFFQAANGLFVMLSLRYLPGPIMVIILFSHSLMLLFFLAWKKEIKLDRLTVVTTIAALFGLTLVVDFWHQSTSNWIGIAYAFGAALVTVSRLYIYGKQTKTRPPAAIGAENFLVAAIITLGFLFFQWPHAPTQPVGWIWLAVSAGALTLGTFGMFYGIALLGSFRWSLFTKLEPVFTSIFSVLFLGEILKTQQYAGIALVIVSLVTYQVLTHKKAA